MKTNYRIDIEYANDKQKREAEKFLDSILKSFQIALQVKHKDNSVTIDKLGE